MFQSTHPVGCDYKKLKIVTDHSFVSIHASRGMRPNRPDRQSTTRLFQSTHPVGCDNMTIKATKITASFNPRIPWDATIIRQCNKQRSYSFNPRIPWDATEQHDASA